MSYILFSFGTILLLLGIVYYIIYDKHDTYKGYKTATGCIIERLSEDDNNKVESVDFGYEVIKNRDDEVEPVVTSNAVYAIEVEYLVKKQKYRITERPIDAETTEIGQTVTVKYNPKDPAKAYISAAFYGYPLLIVGAFLIILGVIVILL